MVLRNRCYRQNRQWKWASGVSGKTNGAACDDDPATLEPDEFAPKIVIKMVRLFVTPPVGTLFLDLADRPTAAFECLGAIRRVMSLATTKMANGVVRVLSKYS